MGKIAGYLGIITAVCIWCGDCRSQGGNDPGRYFSERGVNGAFVLYDLKNDRYVRYNPAGCRKGYLPASTFKIFNTLAGLETGVIGDENFTLKWNGVPTGNPVWDRDHDLASAVKYSAIWYFQEVARRIGAGRMRRYLELARYGSGNLSAGIDRFWLEGKFAVSPDQQVDFLKRMYMGEVPFSRRNIDIVKKVLVTRECGRCIVHAKTGLYMCGKRACGWWVGYTEVDGNTYFFATHIQGTHMNRDFIDARIEITEKILGELIPCGSGEK